MPTSSQIPVLPVRKEGAHDVQNYKMCAVSGEDVTRVYYMGSTLSSSASFASTPLTRVTVEVGGTRERVGVYHH